MHALHSTLLPSSAIFYSLYLPNFTPSTIYQLPRPAKTVDAPDVTVLGNLVLAGGEDLRVFEIREESVPIREREVNNVNGVNGDSEMVEEDFFDTGHAEVRCYAWVPTLTDGSSEHLCDMRRPDDCTYLLAINCMGPSLAWRLYGRWRVVWMAWTDCLCLLRMRRLVTSYVLRS